MGLGSSSESGERPAGAAPVDDDEAGPSSYWDMASNGYQELVNAIIRPPRAEYDMDDLGPASFEWHGHAFQRVDLELVNPRGMRLACSHWSPAHRTAASPPRPCLVYLHGNSSARVEAVSHLALCLSIGIDLFALDFAGSGKSDGDWVSLGYWERDDLATVVAHLRASGKVSTVALWGRSMGSACALCHGHRDPSISAMVCDGAFADLPQLAEELVQKARDHGLSVPGFVVSIALRMVRSSVLKTADFKLEDVSPIKHVDSCFVPALFVAGERDDFIDPAHSRALHGKYAGDKNLVLVEGDHNSPRPRFLYDSAAIFLSNYMGVPPAAAIPGADAFNGGYPPWIPSDHYGLNLADLGFSDLDLDQQNLGMTRDRQAEVQDTISNVRRPAPAAAVRGRAAAPRRRAAAADPPAPRRASAPPPPPPGGSPPSASTTL
ncbi:palmitoyl-(protein) hydrolase [Aureococcus anophagefferens]|uniref:Palmitoyl-(Protein) hydrolase n=2 Tax=Aureococcus anophagefferens TaxID=44056 RepID=A0ABR1FM92_AURAN